MLKRMNDIHKYLRKDGLVILRNYRYDFVNIETTGIMKGGSISISSYYFVFITELESPYTVYVNIVPNEILNPIQISYHHNCHFRYLNLSKLDGCPLNVHENLLIKMDKGEVYATIFNQSYYDNYNKKQVNLKYIKYLLFVKPRYYNCRHELLPPNFSIQLDLIKKAFLLEKEYDENLFDVVCNLEAELEAITNKMQYTPFIDE